MGAVIDETGNRYDRLLVIGRAGYDDKHKRATWLCECDCGRQTIVVGSRLRSGNTRSCGCIKGEQCIKIGRANALPEGEAAFGRLLGHYQREARIRGVNFELTCDEFRLITSLPCHYCGIPPNQVVGKPELNGDYIYNGIDRKASDRGYSIGNVVPCCKICNRAKRDMMYEEFLEYLDRVVRHRGQ